MKKVFFSILLLMGLTLSTGACSPDNDPGKTEVPTPAPNPNPDPNPAPEPNPEPGNGRSLVIYFSRSGNTRAVANEIRTQTDATILEVVPTTAYPSDYDATLTRAREEISAIDNSGSYPPISTAVDNFGDYDIVFICAPLWYARMATPMQSFLNTHSQKLAGKRLALVVTSSSSGISSVVDDAQRLCSGSTFAGDALWVRASQVGSVQGTVRKWLDTLGLSDKPGNSGQLPQVKSDPLDCQTIT